jgi:hypothetical protein
MTKYKVLAVEYGLNLNSEFITDSAMESFTGAFTGGLKSNWGHRDGPDDWTPCVGEILETSVENGQRGFAVVDYNPEITEQITNGRHFDVSIYAKCKSHYDDKDIRIIDEFVYDPNNSIDIVSYGAIPNASIQEPVSDQLKKDTQNFVSYSIKGMFSRIENGDNDVAERMEVMSDKLDIEPEPSSTEPAPDVAANSCTDEQAESSPKEPDDTIAPNISADPLITAANLSEAFLLGAQSGLKPTSAQWVADQVKNGGDIKKLVEIEIKRIAEITDEVKNEQKSEPASDEVVSEGVKIYPNAESGKGYSNPLIAAAFTHKEEK